MWLLVALAVLGGVKPRAADGAGPVTRVYLLRHAEKASKLGRDPPLTPAGERRAAALAELLGSEPIEVVMATAMRRTQATVGPLASALGVDVRIVRDQPGQLARVIRRGLRGKTVVFAGHSTTLPALIRALGCRAKVSLTEQDYGDLFVVVIDARGTARLTRRRYGD